MGNSWVLLCVALVLKSVLCSIFISSLEEGARNGNSKFLDETELLWAVKCWANNEELEGPHKTENLPNLC